VIESNRTAAAADGWRIDVTSAPPFRIILQLVVLPSEEAAAQIAMYFLQPEQIEAGGPIREKVADVTRPVGSGFACEFFEFLDRQRFNRPVRSHQAFERSSHLRFRWLSSGAACQRKAHRCGGNKNGETKTHDDLCNRKDNAAV
jgi:hypothetical protein